MNRRSKGIILNSNSTITDQNAAENLIWKSVFFHIFLKLFSDLQYFKSSKCFRLTVSKLWALFWKPTYPLSDQKAKVYSCTTELKVIQYTVQLLQILHFLNDKVLRCPFFLSPFSLLPSPRQDIPVAISVA